MANYHSIIHNYGRPQSTFNTELAVQALGYKQQKYDANAAKIDELISSYGDIELSRPEAKEYLYEKLNGLVNSIDGLQGADLSSRNVTSGIMGHISKALDPTIINEYQSTQYEKDYFKQAEEAKKKGTYNDANFYEGYKNIKQWQESELGTPMGKINYTPYKDVKAEKMEQMEKLLKLKGIERVWDEKSENGMVYKMKGNVIEPGEIRAMYDALLTTEDKNQFRIESEYLTSTYSEQDKAEKVQEYQDNVDLMVTDRRKEEEALRSKATNLSGPEKEQALAAADNLKNNIENLVKTKDRGFDSIAFQMYDESVKQGFVDMYKVNTVTDYELNMDMLNFENKLLTNQKLRGDIAKQEAEASALQAGQDYNMVATAGEQGVGTAYIDTTMKGLEEASNNLVAAVTRDSQNLDDNTFKDTYGVDKQTFNGKSAEEKKRFLGSKVETFLKDGVDITASGMSQELIDASNEYRAADQAFKVVADEVAKGSQDVAEGLFEGMVRGVKDGSFNPDNFQNKKIANILKNNLKKSYNELDSEAKKIFEISAIDESIRSRYIEDEATQKVLVRRRENLISEIQDPEIKKTFRSVKTLGDTVTENTISGFWKLLTTPMNLLDSSRPNSSNPQRTKEALQEIDQAVEDIETTWFLGGARPDQTLSDLGGSSFLTAPDFYARRTDGTYAPANAGEYVKERYKNIVTDVTAKAAETAPKLASTRTIVLNPNIKAEKDQANVLKGMIASAKGINVDDLSKESVEVTYNKADRSFTVSSNLKRSASLLKGPNLAVKESTTIPFDMFPLEDIKRRTKQDDDSWALNAQNPQASNLKFTSGGFKNQKERADLAATMLEQGKIGQQEYLQVMQDPRVLGMTGEEKKSTLNVERVVDGNTITFAQEYPNAYAKLVDPATKLIKEVNNRKGMYVTQYSINTPQGTVTLPFANSAGTQLNYNNEYVSSFSELNNVYNEIIKGYAQDSEEITSILKELNAQ